MNKSDRFSEKEWAELASLLSEEKNNNNTELLNRFLEDDDHDTIKLWKELGGPGDIKEIDVDNAWEKLYSKLDYSRQEDKTRLSKIIFVKNSFVKVAAGVLILLSLGYSGIYLAKSGLLSKKITSSTGYNQKNLLVTLPDGSRIHLNRSSDLSYNANFGKQKREVKLNGEAYFEITSDTFKPFIIDAGKAKIKVVGTSFNVITKNDHSAVEVFVKSGKVELSDNSGSNNILIDPGYIGTMNANNSGKSLNSNPNYLSWYTEHLVYDGQKLDIVFHDLKRVYNMDIITDDPGILEYRWTSPIDNQPQDTIIRLICASFNLSYTKVGTVYHLSKK